MGPALSTDSPHCEETEQLLLGAILVENNVLNKVGDVIKVEHFFCSIHRNIYDAIIKLIEQGRVVTPLSLSPYLQSDPELEAVGGISYLADLAAAVVTPLQALDHALIIRDHWVRRSVLELATAACQQIKVPTPDVSVYDVIAGIERDLSALNDCNDKRFEPVELERACAQAIEAVDAAMKRGDAITGITTGLRDLDWRISGLAKGELIVLAGRPGMGKSDLALNICAAAGRSSVGVASFSQEMTAAALGMRYLAQASMIPASELRAGRIEPAQCSKLVDACTSAQLPVWIDETPAIDCDHIIRVVRRLRARRKPVDMVVVDHIQLMRAAGMSRVNEVSLTTEITGRLKAIAKSLDVAVLALSQLNRSVESREDKRPNLADLRSSGSIEQDADVVLALYRDEYYAKQEEPNKRQDETDDKYQARYLNWEKRMTSACNLAEIICLKQRCGPVGTTQVYYDAAHSLFRDLARQR